MDNDEMMIMIKDMFETSVEKIEKKFDEKTEEVKNHMGVITEGLRSDLRAVAEGHSLLNNKIDEVKEEISDIKSEMTVVKNYVIGVDAILNEHETILKKAR